MTVLLGFPSGPVAIYSNSTILSLFMPLYQYLTIRNHKYKYKRQCHPEKHMGGCPSPQVTYKLLTLEKGV